MSVQSRSNLSNLAFLRQGLPIPLVRGAEVVKQNAARSTTMLAGTVMAQLASTRRWIPLSNTAENSAEQETSAGPFVMAPGDTLVIDVDNVGNATATFDAASGYITTTNAWPISDATGKTIKLKIDDGETQTITLGTCTTRDHLLAFLNQYMVGASAIASSTHARIVSDVKGTDSTVEIVSGGTATDITFGSATAGTGDVGNIKAVTPAEFKTVVEADTTANVTVSGSVAVISSPTTGDGSELQFVSGKVLTAIGVSAGTVVPTSVDGGCHPAGILMQDLTAAQVAAGDVSAVSILVGGAIVNENMVVFEGGVTKNSVVAVSGLNKTVESILRWNNLHLESVVDIDAFEN